MGVIFFDVEGDFYEVSVNVSDFGEDIVSDM